MTHICGISSSLLRNSDFYKKGLTTCPHCKHRSKLVVEKSSTKLQ